MGGLSLTDVERYAAVPVSACELALVDDPEAWSATPGW